MSVSLDKSVGSIRGVGPELADRLRSAGYESIDDLDDADPGELMEVDGVGLRTLARLCKGEPETRL